MNRSSDRAQFDDETERDIWHKPEPVDRKAAVAEARRILAAAVERAEARVDG